MTARVLTEIRFSRHARQRYSQRVGPQIDETQLERALAEVVRHGALTTRPPQWFTESAQTSSLHLVVGDVLFPLREHPDGDHWIAMTCLVRGGISDTERERRNRRRAAETQRTKARRRR